MQKQYPSETVFALKTFIDEKTRYQEGQTYEVSIDKVGYFVRMGWAKTLDGDEIEDEDLSMVELQIDNQVIDSNQSLTS